MFLKSFRRQVTLVVGLGLFSTPIASQTASAVEISSVDAPIIEAIDARLFPGAVVVVGRADTILYAAGYGQYTWSSDSRRPDPSWSLWDVASLSKVVATASAVAVLIDNNRLTLDAPVGRYLPNFRGESKDKVTVGMLLSHTSGLPAWVPLRSNPQTIDGARAKLFETDLRRTPGTVAVYSDLNAILAAMIVERVSDDSFEEFTRSKVFLPTGMTDARWRPEPADQLRSVPSERRADGSSRMGRVHDTNAQYLGGVAGHAGVFATGFDLASFSQQWLKGLAGQDSSWVDPVILRRFLRRSPESGTRALGWDTPLPQDEISDGGTSLYGSCATMTTYGHTGFTGTMIWFDTASDLFVVLLTNRSYDPPRRSLEAIRGVRAAVSDAARRFAGERCQ